MENRVFIWGISLETKNRWTGKMVSSKGKPTDQKLHDEVKEEVKQKTNKDGGGKGQWSAWKATELSKEYERRGGGYENEAGSKNEPKKGAPQPKSAGKRKKEEKEEEKKQDKEVEKEKETSTASDKHDEDDEDDDEDDVKDKENAKPSKPKANTAAKKSAPSKKNAKDAPVKQDKKEPAAPKKTKEKTEGTRKSSRIADAEGGKRKMYGEDGEGNEEGEGKAEGKGKGKKSKA
ncbi:hypothetical protein IAQ61_009008 [Plenodomus lingam]|uniref:uncharacterized protein n=1 Tax=Leptosphaeria maculans TaxID=5022 RepID=UPI00332F7857|nr:hypothetical protein IAQ61_009008 [Plenodomus lingam]